MVVCCLLYTSVGGAFGILYVLLAGMKEVSWLNMINAVFMYAALIIALIAMFVYLPGNGWEDVAQNITCLLSTSTLMSSLPSISVRTSFNSVSVSLFRAFNAFGLLIVSTAKNHLLQVQTSLRW